MKMHHVGISVTSIEKSIAFYQEMLGMELACPVFPFGGPQYENIMAIPDVQGRMCVVRKGNVMIELFEFSNPKPAPKDPNYPVCDRGLTHFGFEITDIEGTYERLLAAGVKFHSPVLTFEGGMKAAYGRDLDGNVFELLEMGPPPAS